MDNRKIILVSPNGGATVGAEPDQAPAMIAKGWRRADEGAAPAPDPDINSETETEE